VGDETWKERVVKDHVTQVQTQLAVLQLQYCIYVVAQAGVKDGSGRIIYIMIAQEPANEHYEFQFQIV